MFLPIILLLVSSALIYYYLVRNYGYWKKRNVPGPKPKLVVGNFKSLFNQKIHMVYEIDAIYRQFKGKSPVAGVFSGVTPNLLVLSPEVAKQVMITNFSHFVNQAGFGKLDKDSDPIIGRNPFFLNDDEWKEKRGEIIPAFSSGRIKALWPIMETVYGRMSEYIQRQMAAEGVIETRELCARYTTDVVSSAIYGIESGAFTDENSKIRALARNVFTPNWRLMIIFMLAPLFPQLGDLLKVRFMPKKDADFMTELLTETLRYRKENKVDRQDYVDFLIQLQQKKGLIMDEMVAHTASFFFDGIETSSITLSNLFYEIAKHPEIQSKLRAEILTVRKADGSYEYDSVMDLQYLEQAIYETLRLHPVILAHTRRCGADFDISLSDGQKLTIPKGMHVMLPIYNLQRDEDHYDKPDEFNPDRFNEENGGIKLYRDKCVLFPFGDGPRICLGQRFAMTQMKCCIANMLTHYELTLDKRMPDKYEFDPEQFIMAIKGGIHINFKPINA